ncbi:MAG TPA: hypothetical protein VF132_03500 [Rudaea sp.]
MARAIVWIAVVALALLAKFFDSAWLRGAGVLVLLGALAWQAPRALRVAFGAIFAIAAALVAFDETALLLDAVPALIAGLVAWLFGRTLVRDRRPLIARAIAAIDGENALRDPQVGRYARRLTFVWTIYQGALAAFAAFLALHRYGVAPNLDLPAPAQFGLIGLPVAVALLFLIEFSLRRVLLPQVPRHSFFVFLRHLWRAWPALLGD